MAFGSRIVGLTPYVIILRPFRAGVFLEWYKPYSVLENGLYLGVVVSNGNWLF